MNKERVFRLYSLLTVFMLLISPLSLLLLSDPFNDQVKGESILDPVSTITENIPNSNLGWNVSWAGDINGDGLDDIIAGAPNVLNGSSQGNWWDSNWSYRQKLIFNNAGQSEDLVNFPVLVNLSLSNFDILNAKIDGSDIRFIDEDDLTELKYHMEKWNPSGNSYIWVNVTRIDSSSSSDFIWLYYGNPTALDAQDVRGTYNSDYLGVWHLNETSGIHYDATSNNLDGTQAGGVTQDAMGKIDGADEFDGTDDIISVSDDDLLTPSNDMTIEVWAKINILSSVLGDDQNVLLKDHSVSPFLSYEIFFDDPSDEIDFTWANSAGESSYTGYTGTVSVDIWYYIVGVRDGSTARIYINGGTTSTYTAAAGNTGLNSDSSLYIGVDSASDDFNGTIDEVRLSNKARSADWIRAQFLSMNNSFVIYGAQEDKIDGHGATHIFFGHPGISLTNIYTTSANVTIYGEDPGDQLGWSVGAAGDVNSDGIDDVIIGAPGWSDDTGRAYIFYGRTPWNASYNTSEADVILTGGNPGDRFGSSLAGIKYAEEQAGLVGWLYRKKITISSSQVVEDLVDFPVLINITDSDLQSRARSDGYDIFFTKFDGSSRLNHEVEHYNGSSGELVAWVRIPSLSSSTDTTIYMYYGNSGQITPMENPSYVWDSNYSAVWHLDDDLLDSTKNSYDGMNFGSEDKSSIITNGQDFEYDDATDHIDVGTWSVSGQGLTLQAWVKFESFQADDGRIISKAHGEGINEHIWMLSTRWVDSEVRLRMRVRTSSSITLEATSGKLDQGIWYFAVGTYDGKDIKLRLNKTQVGDISKTGDLDANTDNIYIGNHPVPTDKPLDGMLDEMRVSSIRRSDAWLDTEYNNIINSSLFHSSGLEEINAPSWNYRKPITIDSKKVTADLTEFPVLINHIDSDLKNKARVDGFDIVFTLDDGKTKLDHEIESYDNSTGNLVAWVRIPNLSSSSDTVIYLHYGNSLVGSSTENAKGVWDANYMGVWHLEEDGIGTRYDSTEYNNHGTPGNYEGDEAIAFGKIAGADEFDGDNDKISIADNSSLDPQNDITVEAWVRFNELSSTKGSEQKIVFKQHSALPWVSYELRMDITDQIMIQWVDDSQNYETAGYFGSVSIDTWYYIVGVKNGNSLNFLIDSTKTTWFDTTSGLMFDADGPLHFASEGTQDYLNGSIDEVRVSDIARSWDWINTTYRNQNDTSSFYTFGPEESDFESWVFRKPITIKAAQVIDDLSDFPFLISITDSDLKSKARFDGKDIFFTESDGITNLDFEIESYDGNLGELNTWIRIPNLSSSIDTTIYMQYGSSDSSDKQNIEGVWKNGYVGVYHMVEESGDINNSASSTNDGTRVNTPSRDMGQIGFGQEFTGIGADDMFDIGDLGLADGIQENLTLSVWAYINDSALEGWGRIINKRTNSDSDTLYGIHFDNQPTDKDMVFTAGSDSGSWPVGKSVWMYITMTYNGLVKVHYHNGTYVWDDPQGGGPIGISSSAAVTIGARQGPTHNFGGILDEIRLSNVTRSPEWIATEYSNQNRPDIFSNWGSEELIGSNISNNIIIGAFGYDNNRGRAYVFNGNSSLSGEILASSANVIINGSAQGDLFGWDVSGAGDVNNDGAYELIIGAPGNNSNSGAAYVFKNINSLPSYLDSSNAELILLGQGAGDEFGFSVSGTGDLNGDGYDDMIIGAPLVDKIGTDFGSAFIFYGNTTMKITPDVILNGQNDSDLFGFSVAGVNDIDGNGIPEIIVGAPFYDNGLYNDSGAVYVFSGGPAMDNASDWTFKGTTSDEHFGWSVSGSENLDGANIPYLIVGAPNNNDGGSGAGKIYLLGLAEDRPVISGVLATPATQFIFNYINLTCDVTATNGVSSVFVNITIPGGGSMNVSMDPGAGDGFYYYDNYSQPGIYQYTIWATDSLGNITKSAVFQFEMLGSSPVLTLEQVNPGSGYINTDFNFTVTYTHPLNLSPILILVNITGPSHAGSWNMMELNSGDTNYFDGKMYYYNYAGFITGSYSFNFAAFDPNGVWVETGPLPFDILDGSPTLSSQQVSPTTGYINTDFNFTMIYTSPLDSPPSNITVNITGLGVYDLEKLDPLDLDCTDGKAYYLNTSSFPVGNHPFHFAARDTFGNWVEGGTLFFDVLSSTPTLSSPQVNPTTGYEITDFNYTVKYTSPNNLAPDNILVNITGWGNYDLIPIDLLDLDYTDGNGYYLNLSGFMFGSYPFHFAANDTNGIWVETGSSSFDILSSALSLTAPSVNPTMGYFDTGFNFTVNYESPANLPPENITVIIIGYGTFDLVEVDPLDMDYTDGKDYYFNVSGVAKGTYTFRFEANDSIGNSVVSETNPFNIFNRAPTFSSPQVAPNSGNISSGFNFSVIYEDLDDQAPNKITLNITGYGVYDLLEVDPLDTDHTDGKQYYYNASGFSVGSFTFNFAANDTQGVWVETGLLGFNVQNRPPNLYVPLVNPGLGYLNSDFNFTVTYLDLDDHAPGRITVNISGLGIYDLIEIDPLDSNYFDGKDYYLNISTITLGAYTFHFAANDTAGSWIETGIYGFDVVNGLPTLSVPAVNPILGYLGSDYNFTVIYTDLDDQAPGRITVNISGFGVYDMWEIDPLDIDFSNGKEYYFNASAFTLGTYTIHFAANDTVGYWVETVSFGFDVINRPPTLSLPLVDPLIGYLGSGFNFTIIYTDLDDQAPSNIMVNISGLGSFPLFESDPSDTDHTNGKSYYSNGSGIPLGLYSFNFAASDTPGDWVESMILQFDVINRVPTLSFGAVDPPVGYFNSFYNFTITYLDPDGDAPTVVVVNITGVGSYAMYEVDPLDNDYSDGKLYYYNTSNLPVGSHSFHFAANDSLGFWANETPEISGPDVLPIDAFITVIDFTEEYSDDFQVTATLLDNNYNAISGEEILIYIDRNDNAIYEPNELMGSGITNSAGTITLPYTNDLTPGLWQYTALYNGTINYGVTDDEAEITVIPKPATLMAISEDVEEGEIIDLTSLLLDIDGNRIGDELVAFYIDLKQNGIYEVSDLISTSFTSSEGVATISYPVDLTPGDYGFKAKYVGSGNYSVNEIVGLLSVYNSTDRTPIILWDVPHQTRTEDSPPWAIDLTPYEVDVEDSGIDLKWYLTGVDNSLYIVTGMNSTDDVFTFILQHDAYGNDETTLWLVDSSGNKVSQTLWINITPLNDPPFFNPLPPNMFIHFDELGNPDDDPIPFEYTFYVHDTETPVDNLILTTSEPTVDSGNGYAEINGLYVTFHYPEKRVGESILVTLTISDGTDSASCAILVNVTTDWIPELIAKLPNVVLKENSTVYNAFDLDDYFTDKDHNSLFYSSGFVYIQVTINENNTVDIKSSGEWTGEEYVTFRAMDPVGAIVEDTIKVTVIPVNDGPSISGVPDLVVHYDYSYAFDLSPYIKDSDNHTFDLQISSSELSDYIWVSSGNNLGIVINYPELFNGMTIPVTFYVTDGYEWNSQEIQISVTDDFPPELISKLPDVFFSEDAQIIGAFSLSDYFFDFDGDVLFYTNGTQVINVTINPDLSVDFSAPLNWYGSERITFRATDPFGAIAEDSVLVVVIPVNDAPTIDNIPKQDRDGSDEWTLDISQFIRDVDNDMSELIISVSGDFGTSYVKIVGNILIFQYPGDIYEDIVTITVSDGELETTKSFIVTIQRPEPKIPMIWDMIPWVWVFAFTIIALLSLFLFFRRHNKFWVYEVFLIHDKGLPLAHASQKETSELEEVVVSGMFTAVQDFINDAFMGKTDDDEWELDEMKFGENKILIERQENLFLAVVFGGNGDKLRLRVKRLLAEINSEFSSVLNDWDGDMSKLKGLRAMTMKLLSSKKPEKREKKKKVKPEPQIEKKEEIPVSTPTMEDRDLTTESVELLEGAITDAEALVHESVIHAETQIVPEMAKTPQSMATIPIENEHQDCPVCGADYISSESSCNICGTEFGKLKQMFDELQVEIPKCPSCSTVLEKGAPTCAVCGYDSRGTKKKVAVFECPECGDNVKENARFCSQCGVEFIE